MPELNMNTKYVYPYILAPCEIPAYEASTRQFRYGSGMLQYSITDLPPKDQRLKVITIVYELSLVQYQEQQRLVSVHNFVSQIGGNLGLFLGFSCLSTILSFFSCARRFEIDIKKEATDVSSEI